MFKRLFIKNKNRKHVKKLHFEQRVFDKMIAASYRYFKALDSKAWAR